MARFKVAPVTNKNQEGLRFYRPAPYLVVTNMGFSALTSAQAATVVPAPASGKKDTPKNGGAATKGTENQPPSSDNNVLGTVTATLIWLPEPKESYAITLKGGWFGTFNGSVNLTDGWMLTGINQAADAKVAESLTALSGLATGLASSALKTASVVTVNADTKPAPAFFYLFKIDLNHKRLEYIKGDDLVSKLTH
jgi:hypothetical protein